MMKLADGFFHDESFLNIFVLEIEGRDDMQNFSEDQIKRQDFVDNQILRVSETTHSFDKRDRMGHRNDR